MAIDHAILRRYAEADTRLKARAVIRVCECECATARAGATRDGDRDYRSVPSRPTAAAAAATYSHVAAPGGNSNKPQHLTAEAVL